MEATVQGVYRLSFIDDISWWVEGNNDEVAAAKLSEAAIAMIEWIGRNGITFDQGKIEVALFYKKRIAHKITVVVGENKIPFNKEITR